MKAIKWLVIAIIFFLSLYAVLVTANLTSEFASGVLYNYLNAKHPDWIDKE